MPRTSASNRHYEAQSLQERSAKTTNESLNRTRDMLKLMDECQDAGVNTLKNLYGQGEQLNNAERALDETGMELDKAAIRVRNIKIKEKVPCCFIPCVSCCLKDPDSIAPEKSHNAIKFPLSKDSSVAFSNISGTGDNDTSVSTHTGPATATATAITVGSESTTNDKFTYDRETKLYAEEYKNTEYSKICCPYIAELHSKVPDTSEEHEIHRNLDHVSVHVSHLKTIATDLNLETGKQNEQLGRLNLKAETNLHKINRVTKSTTDLVNRKEETKNSPHFCCCPIF